MPDEAKHGNIIDTDICIYRCLYRLPISTGKTSRMLKGRQYEVSQKIFSETENKIITAWITNEFDKVTNRICLKIAKENYILLDFLKRKVKEKWKKISKKVDKKDIQVTDNEINEIKISYDSIIKQMSIQDRNEWNDYRHEKKLNPEYGDYRILAEANKIKQDYKSLSIVSNDGHLTFPYFADKIKEKFSIGIIPVEFN